MPDDAVVTHVVTCQGCDHIRSGCRSLVVVNVHFEHELTLRILRERLCLITPHWPQYPDAIARSWVTSVFANHRKKGSMFGIRHSLMEIRGKLPHFTLFFLTFSKLPGLTLQGETLQSMGLYARCPGSIKRLSIFLWLKRVTSIATPMSPRTLGNGLFRVTMQPYVRLLKNPQFGDNSANASRVLCPISHLLLIVETNQ